MDLGFNIRQWVGMGGFLDHLPIYMEMESSRDRLNGLFKFISTWLKEALFISMVTNFWKENPLGERENVIVGAIHNLTELKKMSKI